MHAVLRLLPCLLEGTSHFDHILPIGAMIYFCNLQVEAARGEMIMIGFNRLLLALCSSRGLEELGYSIVETQD